jgi:hypothetical protein
MSTPVGSSAAEAVGGEAPLALNVTAKHPTARFPLDRGEFMPDGSRLAELTARMREWLRAVG